MATENTYTTTISSNGVIGPFDVADLTAISMYLDTNIAFVPVPLTGLIKFQLSTDGVSWFNAIRINGSNNYNTDLTGQQNCAGAGFTQTAIFPTYGFSHFRIITSGYVSGTAFISVGLNSKGFTPIVNVTGNVTAIGSITTNPNVPVNIITLIVLLQLMQQFTKPPQVLFTI